MNGFRKQRFPKTALALFIIAVLVFAAFVVRVMLGATLHLPDNSNDPDTGFFPKFFIPIVIIGAASMLITSLLWLIVRKKGIRWMDVLYPINILGGIAIFLFFHFTLLG